MKRPKLSNKDIVNVPPGGAHLSAPTEEIVDLGEKGASLRLIKTIVGLVLAAILVIFALYVALAATLMRAIPDYENFPSFTWVKNATFVAGIPDPGTHVYIDPTGETDNSLAGNLKQAFMGVEYGTVLEIIGGPYGTVASGIDGEVLIDGAPTGYTGNILQESKILKNEYVAICIRGACDELDEIIFIPEDFIIGEAEFYYDSVNGMDNYDKNNPSVAPQITLPDVEIDTDAWQDSDNS